MNIKSLLNSELLTANAIAQITFLGEICQMPHCKTSVVDKNHSIDWYAILQHLLSSDKGRDFTLAQAALAIWRYWLFLLLAQKYPRVPMVPNQEIDAVLHAHIATARQNWEDDCQKLLGVSFVHSPGLGTRGEVDRQEWLLAFAHTQELFEEHFGQGAMGNYTPACCQILPAST